MKVQLEHILQNLFHKPTLEEVRVDELQQMVKEHPYFSAGHFLLAQKLKQQHSNDYEEQARKAVLYFHDPLWLQWQLSQVENGKEELEPEEELAVTTIGPVEEAIPATPAEVEHNMPEEVEAPQPPTEETFHEPEPEPAPQPGPEPKKEQEVSFDPYYTIDYFASQGIKVPIEVQPGDKLGKQLKSFTEWLKTMKRLPQVQPEEQPVDEAEQQSIRKFAAGSLEEKQVITETMAEVLAKQGRNAEAADIYNKLSLSDPSKSAYFAAKIEKLKEN